ncbi:MAG: glycosyltransferase [Anaerovibrio sp.]
MIDILMATYNGEKYIEEQLQSIINQTYQDWRLIISDDCSTDKTVEILKRYQQRYSKKILVYENNISSGSAKNNFYKLLDYATSEYVMFSDQDDVWKKDKIAITYNKMLEMQKEYGNNMPLLIHTDLCVVDENLNIINNSLFSMQQMDYTRDKLNNLLIENIVTGCTVMVNRALLGLVDKKPQHSVMHDMWLALLAAAFGKIGFVNESTIFYRQHGHNSVGAKDVASFDYYVKKISSRNKIHNSLMAQYCQAEEMLNMYFKDLDRKTRGMLCEYAMLSDVNRFYRAISLLKYKLGKKSVIKVLAQIIYGIY